MLEEFIIFNNKHSKIMRVTDVFVQIQAISITQCVPKITELYI